MLRLSPVLSRRLTSSMFHAALLWLCSALLAASVAQAQVPAMPDVAARAWLVMDVTSGQVLASRAPNEPIEPASLTKLMTAYLSFTALKEGRIKTDQKVRISDAAYKQSGSRMFLDKNVPASVEELLHGLIIQSGNDAAVALAEAIAGSEQNFADQMNREAQRMGLTKTHFVNATGMPDTKHVTTASDLARLATRLIQDYPDRLPIYSTKEYTYNKIKQPNRNRLLWIDPTVDGLKTGRTDTAGWCLIATAKREQPLGDGSVMPRRVLSVVLGAASDDARAQESQKLLNWAFGQFDTVRLYRKGDTVVKIPVYKGQSNELTVGLTSDFYATIPRGMANQLKVSVERPANLVAPISVGQHVATMHISLDGKPYADTPLLSQTAVEPAGWFGRMVDSVKLMLK